MTLGLCQKITEGCHQFGGTNNGAQVFKGRLENTKTVKFFRIIHNLTGCDELIAQSFKLVTISNH